MGHEGVIIACVVMICCTCNPRLDYSATIELEPGCLLEIDQGELSAQCPWYEGINDFKLNGSIDADTLLLTAGSDTEITTIEASRESTIEASNGSFAVLAGRWVGSLMTVEKRRVHGKRKDD